MKIKELYFSSDALYNIIEMPDGTLYKFLSAPYRKITDSDLVQVKTPLSNEMYLMAAHAETYGSEAIKAHVMAQYGLTTEEM